MAANKLLTLSAITSLAASVLAACSDAEETPEVTTPNSAPVTTSSTPTTSSETSASETTGETSSSETSSRTPSSEASTSKKEADELALAQETFASVLPEDIWKKFDSCSSTGLEDTFECSGAEVGQFQLFDSQSKAASTTQLLTELRSSRVVTDTGRFVIGWSTLGTTAVVTIVDNDMGLVAQQLVSSDQVEPDERISKLGLDKPAGLE